MLYLDNSATTKPYPEALAAFTSVAGQYFGNPSSLHKLGIESERLLKEARKQTAQLLKVHADEIIFTSGGTESNNMAVKGAAFFHERRGKHIIASSVEHPSILETFHQLEKEFGFEATYIPVDGEGRVSAMKIQEALRPDTILVSVMHVNNEVGTVQPITEIGKAIKQYNQRILFHVDHVQGAAKVPLNIKEANIDLLSLSGHKFHGLNGTGVLFVKQGVEILPLLSGGSQESSLRSGTESIAGIVSLAKALRLSLEAAEVSHLEMSAVKKKLMNGLAKMEGVQVNTPIEGSAPHIVNFSVPGIKAEVLLHMLEDEGIILSTTSACSSKAKKASAVLMAMGKGQAAAESSLRVSFSYDASQHMADKVLNCLEKSVTKLKHVMR
ncbi:aminotransferase class V-fold PLP-dependent enzyme [Bacillus lacus]|uniref:Aminotransferase class V-fold PLP-dependent enzyme n=1 Tax=Metabacillus lacus TaxID=1983721 RepID=A0A7X2M0F0_9BACI|nr:cysteine desulfurase family protein [Metabacillus lacus]MRX72754.1 aminotransferase class V-fold PLP-dependent enzyme [Metabacillus lacus]